jgi:hypothetical protein
MRRILTYILVFLCAVALLLYVLSWKSAPQDVTYGASFSKLHADELGVPWQETYLAILDDMQVRHLRLSAHWPMIEPDAGQYRFDELDFQMQEARKRGADVVLAVGRRTPGWPECHTPQWAVNLTTQERQEKQLSYMTEVVKRYKDAPNLRYWQVENEPFLYFAPQYCGEFDEAFFAREVALVRSLDPAHKVLVTDSGELGRWYKAKSYGDVFGTSMYLYVWYEHVGFLRYPILPGFFRMKQYATNLLAGQKPSLLIELGAEPWLPKPLKDASLEEQLSRMNATRIQGILSFAKETGFSEQYLWGAEWWYYMKEQGHPEIWDMMKKLYTN